MRAKGSRAVLRGSGAGGGAPVRCCPGMAPHGHMRGHPWAGSPQGNARTASPPPQRRHLARSLPVPRGRTATGGCFSRFALSAEQGERGLGQRWRGSAQAGLVPCSS